MNYDTEYPRPTVQEEAERLLGYWERHGDNPETVAKWAFEDLMGFLRFFAEGDDPHILGPDGFTPLAPDASQVERNYAAFVGAEAELTRLRSAVERLADLFDSTPEWSMVHRNVAISLRTALTGGQC